MPAQVFLLAHREVKAYSAEKARRHLAGSLPGSAHTIKAAPQEIE